MVLRKRWYVIGVVALLYWMGSADEKSVSPKPTPSRDTSVAIKSSPAPPQKDAVTLQPPETAYVTASRLNVRKGPSTSHIPVVQLSRGVQVTVLSRQSGWVQIQTGKFTGWVAEGFVQRNQIEQEPAESPVQQQAPEVAYVDASRLNVRSGPGTGYKQVWTLKSNERVTIVGRSDKWAKLKGDRYEGWVHGDYLTTKPASATVISAPSTQKMSSAQAKKILIGRSLALYDGPCPCPYNVMRNGRRCGGNSAYSRPGGASPLCYPRDVSDEMVRNYIARQ